MSNPEQMPIGQITVRIAMAYRRLWDAIAPLSTAQLQAPVLADGWSVKDVLAHLAFWDRRLLHAIEPEAEPEDGGQVSRLFPPAIADIPYDDRWLDAVNARVYSLNLGQSLEEVLTDFAVTQVRLPAVVALLSPHAVYDPDGLSALLGEPFAPMLLGAYEHYEEHTEELEAYTW